MRDYFDKSVSIHHLLKTIRGAPCESVKRQPKKISDKNTDDGYNQNTTGTKVKQRQLKLLKRELKKADAMLCQLEQEDNPCSTKLKAPLVLSSSANNTLPPISLIRKSTQVKSLYDKTCLGLDIGSRCIKTVELGYTTGGYVLLHYAIAEIISDTNISLNTKAATEAINQSISGINTKKTIINTCIGGESTIIRQISMPVMPMPELSSLLQIETKKLFPNKKKQMDLNFHLLEKSNGNARTKVLLTLVPHHVMLNHSQFLQLADIKPNLIEIAPLSLLNSYLETGNYNPDEIVAILDIGAENSSLNIYHETGGYFIRNLSISGNSFTKQIQKVLNREFIEAEDFKQHADKNIIFLLYPILQKMTREIRQSLVYYRNKSLNNNFKRLLLTGGGAKLPHIDTYLASELGLKVEIFNPLDNLNIDTSPFYKADLADLSCQFATAMSLSLRGFKLKHSLLRLPAD